MNQQLPQHSNGVLLSLDELLQYKAQAIRWLPPAKSLWSQLNGQHESRSKGRGMNFSEVRQYQAGDDIRSIDWRVTARTGKPHTKIFSEEREQPVILYLDMSNSMMFGSTLLLKSVQLAHLTSQLCWLTIAGKDRIGAVIDDGQTLTEIKPSSSHHAPLRILQQLIAINNQSVQSTRLPCQTDFSMALKSLNRLSPKGSDIIFLSDFNRYKDSDYSLLNQMRQHNRIRFVHFYDPLEQGNTSFKGMKHVSDGERTQWFNFSSKAEKNKLKTAFEEHQQQIKDLCLRLAIPHSSITSAEPLMKQISGGKHDA